MTANQQSQPGRLISVHSLGEFAFCERAGVLADASDIPNRVEDPAPLDYLPKYELHAIERELSRRITWLTASGGMTLLSFIAAIALRPWLGPIVTWWAIGGIVVFGWLSLSTLSSVLTLADRLREARQAAAASPPDELDTEFPVNWWRLLADGWESSVCQDAYIDESLGLVGAPWRVLRRGDLKVPVIRSTAEEESVRTKHRLRLAAYCRLVEVNEGGRSPYGIVIFAGEYDGVATPRKLEDDGWLERTVNRLVQRLQEPQQAEKATSPAKCRGCRYGKPRKYVAGESESTTRGGDTLAPFPVKDSRDTWRHSDCGDCYRWAPPHRLAGEFGML